MGITGLLCCGGCCVGLVFLVLWIIATVKGVYTPYNLLIDPNGFVPIEDMERATETDGRKPYFNYFTQLEKNMETNRNWNHGTGCTGEVVRYFNAGEAVSFKKASFIHTMEMPKLQDTSEPDEPKIIMSNPLDYAIPA